MEDENLLDESESTNEDTELELEETLDDDEDIEEVRAKAEKANTFAKQAVARAKKAEAELKALKGEPKKEAKAPQITNGLDDESVERKILKSQGLKDDLIDELSALAKVRGKSLLDTLEDPIYLKIKEQKEEEAKEKKAKLPASKGSGTVKSKRDTTSPDLSEEEHKALWKESAGL